MYCSGVVNLNEGCVYKVFGDDLGSDIEDLLQGLQNVRVLFGFLLRYLFESSVQNLDDKYRKSM